jgi:hypothetical protein
VLLLLQDDIDLTEILRSFKLPEGQLEFSFEELFKATTMHKVVSVMGVSCGVTCAFQQLFEGKLRVCCGRKVGNLVKHAGYGMREVQFDRELLLDSDLAAHHLTSYSWECNAG